MTRKDGTNPEKLSKKLNFDQYLVKVDGGGRLTRRNRRFLKKIISTLADKEIIENKEINDGDERNGCRRSTRLVEKNKEVTGGDRQSRDGRKGGDGRDKD